MMMNSLQEQASQASGLQKQTSQASGLVQSTSHRDLLDIVDQLRSNGVSHYVNLPQIIVCGSQSSGKSSTLEAISGISFPTSEGLCTRFATELILRRSPVEKISVQINPGAGRSDQEKASLQAFSRQTTEYADVGKIIEAAKTAMGLSGVEGSKIFSTDVLRIECESPLQGNLTIVDLPGLFGAADKNQSDDDSRVVQELVLSYMRQPRSIILAVVSADNQFANQPVTKLARDVDPTGSRTLGLITKPDKLDRDSESERYYLEMLQNKNVKLNLGWHVIRNRGFKDDSSIPRDELERQFFSEKPWTALNPSQLGIGSLRTRLRKVLWSQIFSELPGVRLDVKKGINECKNGLRQLGSSRETLKEQQSYLLRASNRLCDLLKASINGVYTDAFFVARSGDQEKAMERRLRAMLQDLLTRFATKMAKEGHRLEIVDEDVGKKPMRAKGWKSRSTYIKEEVTTRMRESRGRELPGTFNPQIVGELFSQQSEPWEGICQLLVEAVEGSTQLLFKHLVDEVCDQDTRERIKTLVVGPALERLSQDLKNEVDKFLEPHRSGHPITYNHYLTENVQKAQADRQARRLEGLIEQAATQIGNSSFQGGRVDTMRRLFKDSEPNMETYAASLAVDMAEAYYKVALKKFIDDISVNVIEVCLVGRLPGVFCPEGVCNLADEDIERIASEDPDSVNKRILQKEKLRVLEEGLKELDKFSSRT